MSRGPSCAIQDEAPRASMRPPIESGVRVRPWRRLVSVDSIQHRSQRRKQVQSHIQKSIERHPRSERTSLANEPFLRAAALTIAATSSLLVTTHSANAASAFASSIVSYTPGAGVGAGYNDPTRAIGQPTRLTGIGTDFQSTTNPFAPAYESSDLVTVGRGGSLVLAFDHAITNDAANPFGVDLLVFGNSFYTDNAGVVDGLFGGFGTIEVSADGIDWRLITGVAADGACPTLGYSDVTDPFQSTGSVLTDFTRPVDPAFNASGKSFAQLIAGYGSSGGGASVDLAAVGLESASFVRISVASDSAFTAQIDAISDVSAVPAPATLAALSALALGLARRRRS